MNYSRKIAPVHAEPFEFCIGLVPQQFVRAVITPNNFRMMESGGKGARAPRQGQTIYQILHLNSVATNVASMASSMGSGNRKAVGGHRGPLAYRRLMMIRVAIG